VKAISFTGSTASGGKVALACAPLFKKVSLELGGKNPCIVFDDVAAEGHEGLLKVVDAVTRGAFLNSGQICLCGSNLFVQKPIFEKFMELFTERVRALQVGDPMDDNTDIGPVISEAHLLKVSGIGMCGRHEHMISHISRPVVEDAREKGSSIVFGGRRIPRAGYFYEPTIILHPASHSRAATEEIFGTVLLYNRHVITKYMFRHSPQNFHPLNAHNCDLRAAQALW
jgi:aminomuconate-semialdehyde/2-hydroxymuconate-6-semialdehyde dehydrogenase